MGDLKSGETFEDRVYITDDAGDPALGLTTTCKFYDEEGNETNGVTAELGNGLYHCTDFTPDADGTWNTIWGVTDEGTYTIYHMAKIYKVGGGTIDDVSTALGVVDGYHDVPVADAAGNATIRDVQGNKEDAPVWFVSDVASALGYSKASVAAGGGISYMGKCDAGMAPSTVTIVCDDLKGFGDDFFNTDWVMSVNLNANSHGNAPEGNAPRDIQDYTSATGTFEVAAFSQEVEPNDSIVITKRILHTTDKVEIAAVPTENSLAYKISKFIASGDGDFADSTPLPADTSLYDILLLLKAETDQLPNWRFNVPYAMDPAVDPIASAAEESLTAGSVALTYPTGATRVSATLQAYLQIANKAATAHHIGVTLQAQKNGGGYGDLVDLTANPPVSLVDVDGATASFAVSIDVTAEVDTSGVTYDFKWLVDSDDAGAVNYTSNFVLVMTYSM
jgi:hypothetical protein